MDYEFQITGYQAVAGEVPEPIMVNDQTNADLANLLNGHLLLFRDRIETDSYVAVQLLEYQNAVEFNTIRTVAETVQGSFIL